MTEGYWCAGQLLERCEAGTREGAGVAVMMPLTARAWRVKCFVSYQGSGQLMRLRSQGFGRVLLLCALPGLREVES